ncbi:MAG: hypothetical protein ACK56F_23285, partial [bacterium]
PWEFAIARKLSNPFEWDLHGRVNLLVELRNGFNITVPTLLLSVELPDSAHFVAAQPSNATSIVRSKRVVVFTADFNKLGVKLRSQERNSR